MKTGNEGYVMPVLSSAVKHYRWDYLGMRGEGRAGAKTKEKEIRTRAVFLRQISWLSAGSQLQLRQLLYYVSKLEKFPEKGIRVHLGNVHYLPHSPSFHACMQMDAQKDTNRTFHLMPLKKTNLSQQ